MPASKRRPGGRTLFLTPCRLPITRAKLLHYADFNTTTDAPQVFHAWYEAIGP